MRTYLECGKSRYDMFIEYSCPQCGQFYRSPQAHAGKTVRCSKCGNMFPVPGSAPPLRASASSSPSSAGGDEDSGDDDLIPRPPGSRPAGYDDEGLPEPWFYRFITFYAYLTMVVGLALITLMMISGLIVFLYLLSESPAAAAFVIVVPGIYSFFAALVIVFCSAMLLLIVDMARSFRALRTIARRMPR